MPTTCMFVVFKDYLKTLADFKYAGLFLLTLVQILQTIDKQDKIHLVEADLRCYVQL